MRELVDLELVLDLGEELRALTGELPVIGLIHLLDAIGNWTEPLGLASLFVEGAVVAVASAAYAVVEPRPRLPLTQADRVASLTVHVGGT